MQKLTTVDNGIIIDIICVTSSSARIGTNLRNCVSTLHARSSADTLRLIIITKRPCGDQMLQLRFHDRDASSRKDCDSPVLRSRTMPGSLDGARSRSARWTGKGVQAIADPKVIIIGYTIVILLNILSEVLSWNPVLLLIANILSLSDTKLTIEL